MYVCAYGILLVKQASLFEKHYISFRREKLTIIDHHHHWSFLCLIAHTN